MRPDKCNYTSEGTRGFMIDFRSAVHTLGRQIILTKMEVSTMRRLATPLTLNTGSTTPSSVPNLNMAAVEVGCQHVALRSGAKPSSQFPN